MKKEMNKTLEAMMVEEKKLNDELKKALIISNVDKVLLYLRELAEIKDNWNKEYGFENLKALNESREDVSALKHVANLIERLANESLIPTNFHFTFVQADYCEVVDLESAKYLKKIGFNKPTYYYWLDKPLSFVEKGLKRVKFRQRRMNHNKYDEFIYSAPTEQEVLKWLKLKK